MNIQKKSICAYNGPSEIDGKQIMVILTGVWNIGVNKKTGDMVQAYIIRSDMTPHDAYKSGNDKSVCGNCPLRAGACYVNIWQDPNNVYKSAIKNGIIMINDLPKNHKDLLYNILKIKGLRIGAYGDGAAIPIKIWKNLTEYAFHTGYTHQWANPKFQNFAGVLHASVETEIQENLAQSMGWKTFLITKDEPTPDIKTVVCPYIPYARTCSTCKLCDGTKINVRTKVHGAAPRLHAFNRLINKQAGE